LANDLDISDQWQKDYVKELKPKTNLAIGYEMEFLLLPTGGPEKVGTNNDFERLVKGTADLDSRKKMRDNYGFPHTEDAKNPLVLLANTPNVALLFSSEELEKIALQNKTINSNARQAVRDFFQKQKNDESARDSLLEEAIKNTDLLTTKEIFFLDVLFVKNK